MGGYLTTDTDEKTAVMVALITKGQPEEKVVEYLDELAFLAETLGLEVVKSFTQRKVSSKRLRPILRQKMLRQSFLTMTFLLHSYEI